MHWAIVAKYAGIFNLMSPAFRAHIGRGRQQQQQEDSYNESGMGLGNESEEPGSESSDGGSVDSHSITDLTVMTLREDEESHFFSLVG